MVSAASRGDALETGHLRCAPVRFALINQARRQSGSDCERPQPDASARGGDHRMR